MLNRNNPHGSLSSVWKLSTSGRSNTRGPGEAVGDDVGDFVMGEDVGEEVGGGVTGVVVGLSVNFATRLLLFSCSTGCWSLSSDLAKCAAILPLRVLPGASLLSAKAFTMIGAVSKIANSRERDELVAFIAEICLSF